MKVIKGLCSLIYGFKNQCNPGFLCNINADSVCLDKHKQEKNYLYGGIIQSLDASATNPEAIEEAQSRRMHSQAQ
jgi:hypothetical protein